MGMPLFFWWGKYWFPALTPDSEGYSGHHHGDDLEPCA